MEVTVSEGTRMMLDLVRGDTADTALTQSPMSHDTSSAVFFPQKLLMCRTEMASSGYSALLSALSQDTNERSYKSLGKTGQTCNVGYCHDYCGRAHHGPKAKADCRCCSSCPCAKRLCACNRVLMAYACIDSVVAIT